MATNKTVLVIGFRLGDEEVLAASLAAWQKHFANCSITVIGDKCELPKGIAHIACAMGTGEESISNLIKAAAAKVETATFVFAYKTYPLIKVTIKDIDLPSAEPGGSFCTRLPRLYDKALVLKTKPESKESFEQAYFAEKYKGQKPIVLRDLADRVRLQVLGLRPDEYRTKHLLKYKKFLVTNKLGQKALLSFSL